MDTDVIVVGGGPSGLVTAIEATLQGARVTVLERRTAPVQSRAGTVLPRVLDLFDYRGQAERFIGRARDIRPNPFLTFHIWAGMQPVHWRNIDVSYPYRLILPQNHTEEVLLEIAREAGVTLLHGHTVTGLTQDPDGAAVTAALEDGGEVEISGRYVVGADGGRSITRTLADIPFPGHDGTFTGIITDLPLAMNWPAGRAMTDNEHGWGASFPFGDDGTTTRFNFVHAERRHADKSEPVTADEVRRCLKEIWGLELEFDDVVWASRFTDAMRIADRLREGRVFLVGESARIHYPASGVGMNFCIQDAFNLGWKLGRVVAGLSPDAVLDTYESERRPVMEALLESVQAQCAVQFDFSPEGISFRRMFARDILPAEQVNREIGLQLNGLTSRYTGASDHPAVGLPLPPAILQTVEGSVRVAELLHSGTFVLLDLTGGNAFDGVEVPGTTVVTGVLPDEPDVLRGVTAVVVRPDGYVHWVTTDTLPSADEAGAQLATWALA
ncbi:monooxygenase [Microbacterium pseudoresistens]|uniref:2-polyprenyl-6-methoxyphenol hydroxylase-like FAD-dependent oxidoreductase n=1 Tax=Microbacterium pseudoresistens TaxID=640634 RepID=A0A7Y9JNM9_9MICO|nr:FAD-dependent oxidoreductase [Microbacterium pseudoresistens]NYD53874.1 2-polyprenyl-6-methoxyphenol hydroxylase-like FAD-dependent oxidoreductase [Microbacterium pseudoresistens]